MLTLGLPASGVMALMLGALTIHGIAPGPRVMTQRPDLFWGLPGRQNTIQTDGARSRMTG